MTQMPRWTVPATVALAVATVLMATGSSAHDDPVDAQHSRLLARSVLPAKTYRADTPPSGAAFSETDRMNADTNGVPGPATGPYFDDQPVQGISAMIPDGAGTWFALSDNGYGTRQSSADWQLVVNRIDPRFGQPGAPAVLESIVLSDPDHQVPWRIVCDPTVGDPLPAFDFNALPAAPPQAYGT